MKCRFALDAGCRSIVIVLLFSLVAKCDENLVAEKGFFKKVEASVIHKRGRTFLVGINPGVLPAGERGTIEVRLENPHSFEIPIESASASCGCTKSKLLQDEIPANGHAVLQIVIDTPKKHAASVFAGSIDLKVDQSKMVGESVEHVVVKLSFDIGGLLCFKDQLTHIAIPGSKKRTFVLPFVSTVATPVENLEVDAQAALQGVAGSLLSTESGPAVSINVEPTMASPTGNYGKIVIRDPDSGQSDFIELIIHEEESITLTPSFLHFRKDGERYSAVGIIRHRDLADRANQADDSDKSTVYCEAKLGDLALELKLTPVNDSVYRFKIFVPVEKWESRSVVDDKPTSVAWDIIFGTHRTKVSTKAMVLD